MFDIKSTLHFPFMIWFVTNGPSSDTFTIVAYTIFWLLWMVFHPMNTKSKVAFHLSEGTFDYTPPIIAVAFSKFHLHSAPSVRRAHLL